MRFAIFLLSLSNDAVGQQTTHQRAIAAAQSGKLEEALKLFQQVARKQDTSQSHNNICVAALRLGEASAPMSDSRDRSLQLAKRSCMRAMILDSSNAAARGNYEMVKRSLGEPTASTPTTQKGSAGGGKQRTCPADPTGRAQCALDLLERDRRPELATAALCDANDAVRVAVDPDTVTAARMLGEGLPTDLLLQAKAALRVCGAVILTRAFDAKHTSRLREEQTRLLDTYLSRADVNTTSSAQRSDRRYEVKYSVGDFVKSGGAAMEESTLQNPLVHECVQ